MSQENVELVRRVVETFNGRGRLGGDFELFFDAQVSFKDEIGAYDNREDSDTFSKDSPTRSEDFT